MMKSILLLPSWYPSHSNEQGSYFREQASFLAQNGFDIKVLMIQELHTKNYYFHKLRCWLKGKRFQLTQGYLLQKPDAYSYPVLIQKSWSDEKKLRETDKAYLTAFKKLTKQLHWFPELIHLQGMYKYGLSSYLIAEVHDIPLVVIEHSPFKLTNYIKIYQERIIGIFAIARKVAGVSHFHKACLSLGNTKRDVGVVWNLMDERKFSYQSSSKPEDLFRITTILRASSVKDPITFFDSILRFIQIYDKVRPVEVHVVGLSCLEDLTSMKGIDDKVISKYDKLHLLLKFHNWLDRDNIKELHEKSSVYVSTSRDEPYGIAIRESMLCGTAVISTKSGGPEDTLRDENGLLVSIGDSDAIAEHLRAIYDGHLNFKSKPLRDFVISQSGCNAFLRRMEQFYDV